MIAFSSFDGKVRVYNFADRSTFEFEGHKGAVRALSWNSELPYLLISGADDS